MWLLQNNVSQLDEDSLRSLMVEVEAMVSSRSLTTDDLTDQNPLDAPTPSHFLTMKFSVFLALPENFQMADICSRKRCHWLEQLTDEFWQR